MGNNLLKTRTKTFLEEFGIPVTAFARRAGISESSMRHWLGGTIELSEKSLDKINVYLAKYRF